MSNGLQNFRKEILGQNLYPPSHPYNWPVIGYVDDLDRATLEDLKNFFLRWYGPNNAILTITGDVNSEEVLPLVQKYFGYIKKFPRLEEFQNQNRGSDFIEM